MRITGRRVAALATFALLAGACGGGSSVSTEDFIDDLEDICRDIQRDIDDLGDPEDYAALEDLSKDAQDIFDDGVDRLEELEAPEDLQNDFEDFIAIVADNAEAADDMAKAAGDEDDDAIAEIGDRLEELKADRNDLAEELGADRCISEDESTSPTTDDTTPTSDAPVTAPPISQVPITPPTTIAVDPQGIGTIDIANGFVAPDGYTFQDAGPETLDALKSAYAQTPSLATEVASAGTVLLVDDAGTVASVMFLTFWSSEIEGTEKEDAYLAEYTTGSVSNSEEVTPAGYPYLLYTDPDDTIGLLAVDADVSIWLLANVGQETQVAEMLDGFIAANAG